MQQVLSENDVGDKLDGSQGCQQGLCCKTCTGMNCEYRCLQHVRLELFATEDHATHQMK
jgi:hypothetical protein